MPLTKIQTCFALGKEKWKEHDVDTPFITGVIDPPWPYTVAPGKESKSEGTGILSGYVQNHDRAQNQYPTLSIEDLSALPISNLIGGYCLLWCVSPFLLQGLELLKKWGFEYITNLCWAKYNLERIRKGELSGGYGGVGYWFLGNHEFILLGKKPGFPSIRTGQSSLFVEKKTKHSAKPPNIHRLCESFFPGPYVELFARGCNFDRTKWTLFGNATTQMPDDEKPPQGKDIREELPQFLKSYYEPTSQTGQSPSNAGGSTDAG